MTIHKKLATSPQKKQKSIQSKVNTRHTPGKKPDYEKRYDRIFQKYGLKPTRRGRTVFLNQIAMGHETPEAIIRRQEKTCKKIAASKKK